MLFGFGIITVFIKCDWQGCQNSFTKPLIYFHNIESHQTSSIRFFCTQIIRDLFSSHFLQLEINTFLSFFSKKKKNNKFLPQWAKLNEKLERWKSIIVLGVVHKWRHITLDNFRHPSPSIVTLLITKALLLPSQNYWPPMAVTSIMDDPLVEQDF